jgi:hypothetical protein
MNKEKRNKQEKQLVCAVYTTITLEAITCGTRKCANGACTRVSDQVDTRLQVDALADNTHLVHDLGVGIF